MGSPLGPILSVLPRKTLLEHCPVKFKLIEYIRYIDDTFVLFRNESNVEELQKYLNAKLLELEMNSQQVLTVNQGLPTSCPSQTPRR